MRHLIVIALLATGLFANEQVSFFKASPDNRLLCHLGQYSFKMVSQKNATVVEIRTHTFFLLKDENTYLLTTGCQTLVKQQGIIF